MSDEDHDEISPDGKTIYPARYERALAQRDRARDEVAALKAQLGEHLARIQALEPLEAKATAAEAAAAATAARLAEATEAHEHYRAAASSGIADPEVFELFRWQYGRVSAADPAKRPEFGQWIKDMRAKPDEAPATLRPHLAEPAAKAADPPKKGVTTPAAGSRAPPSPDRTVDERRRLAETPEGRAQIAREVRERRKKEAGA